MSDNTVNFQSEINGRIIKGIGGFYYVDTGTKIYECRARGRFRRDGITPLVGDYVKANIDNNSDTGMVVEISQRKNVLIRPPVANVTQISIVFSVINPKPNLRTVDKLITSAVYADIKPIICINKSDLESGELLYNIYNNSGFETIILSAKEDMNINHLKNLLLNEITVFAGNSGVGKSSILNKILDGANLETGEVSGRVERGKHTTRHSELLKLGYGDGYVIDTPGFSSFSVSDVSEKNLCDLFPDFTDYSNDCQFSDCSHRTEKGCSVLKAVEEGLISKSRHESYMEQYKEILSNKKF